MGGDNAPTAIMDGVGEVLQMFGDKYYLFLVGKEEIVKSELERIGFTGDKRVAFTISTRLSPEKPMRSSSDLTISSFPTRNR